MRIEIKFWCRWPEPAVGRGSPWAALPVERGRLPEHRLGQMLPQLGHEQLSHLPFVSYHSYSLPLP